jgi:3-deoxy-7-phosphoheptulonate synthase
VGFKNGTDGNIKIAVDAIKAARSPHSFIGINNEGQTSIVSTVGNPDVHIVLRGGNDAPNYCSEDIAKTTALLEKGGVSSAIMVDCSHANCYKDHNRQEEVLNSVLDQIVAGNPNIRAVMIESNLGDGSQSTNEDPSQLLYGVSITDKCIGWETTERLLRTAARRLAEAGGRPI